MSSLMAASSPMQTAGAATMQAGEESFLSGIMPDLCMFAVGVVVMHLLMLLGIIPKRSWPGISGISGWIASLRDERAAKRRCAIKQLCAAATAGQHEVVLAAWDREKYRGALPSDALEDVSRALLALAPDRFVADLVEHVARYPKAYEQPSATSALFEVAMQDPTLAESFAQVFQQRLNIAAPQMIELLKL